jgi:RNA polymerase sigma-70 factor (ECF subfamily)
VSDVADNASVAPSAEISRLADHLFRHEAGKLVSVLTGIFGMERLQLAEDVVQEALIRALKTWPFYGIPTKPAAWLMQTAKNLALDLIRREKLFQEKQPEIIAFIEQWSSDSAAKSGALSENELKDRRLQLMFACCHPLIPQESQSALALKTLCGFSPAEIARAFLTTEAAIAKRLTRARQRIHELQVPFEIPSGEEMPARLDGVLQTLYLLFNEGYKASSGDSLVRADLCYEAIRLATLLTDHPAARQPRSYALLPLMLLNAARFRTRTDSAGNILRLKEQNRADWDRSLITLGLRHLARAATGADLSEYHLQAGIAACHCIAADYKSTDWRTILAHYDRWLTISDSPVVALNRAVALAKVNGPQAGVDAVEAIPNRRHLESYYLTYAVLGEFASQLGQFSSAADYFRKALDLTTMNSERAFLSQRVRECEAQWNPTEIPSHTKASRCTATLPA